MMFIKNNMGEEKSIVIWGVCMEVAHVAVDQCFQSVLLRPPADTHPGGLLEMQTPGSHPRLAQPNLWGRDSTGHSGDCSTENHHCRWFQLKRNNWK